MAVRSERRGSMTMKVRNPFRAAMPVMKSALAMPGVPVASVPLTKAAQSGALW